MQTIARGIAGILVLSVVGCAIWAAFTQFYGESRVEDLGTLKSLEFMQGGFLTPSRTIVATNDNQVFVISGIASGKIGAKVTREYEGSTSRIWIGDKRYAEVLN